MTIVHLSPPATQPPLSDAQKLALSWALLHLPETREPGTADSGLLRVLCDAFQGDEESLGGQLTTAIAGFWDAHRELARLVIDVYELLERGE